MEFVEYGSKNAPALIFVHGSCTTAETCYSKVADYQDSYFAFWQASDLFLTDW